MDDKLILMLMDFLVLVALGVTIFMMRNVSSSIRIIRDGKTELQGLLQQLNLHISNAQHAIEQMKKLADDRAGFIQKQIDNAGAVIDELQFIQKAADNVAQRLEKLTTQASGPVREDEKNLATAQGKNPATASTRNMSKAEKELADALAARRAAGKAGD